MSEMGLTELESRCWEDCVISRRGPTSLTFLASRSHIRECCGPFLHLQSLQPQASPFHAAMPVVFSSVSPVLYKDSCDYAGPTYIDRIISPAQSQVINNLNSICKFNSTFPFNTMDSQILVLEHGLLWRPFYAYHCFPL